jgi:H+/Cl- antiporter ClcA
MDTLRSPLRSREPEMPPLRPSDDADSPLPHTASYRANGSLSLKERMEHNPYVQPTAEAYAARMRNHQALDIDLKSSDVHSLEQMRKTQATMLFEQLWGLGAYIFIGVCTGLAAFCIFQGVRYLDLLRHGPTMAWIGEDRLGAAFAWWLGLSLAYGLISACLVVFVAPEAAGSGVPEVKAYLNGTDVPRFLLLVTGLVKGVGVCFSVAAGLVIGKEGPLIHIGACLGSLLSHELAPAPLRGLVARPDRQKRDFVSAGAAAGVAAAFSSPLGGICFAFEEAASYWQVQLTWRVFLSCILTTTVLWGVEAARQGKASFFGLLKYGAFDDSALFQVWELPLMAMLGVAGGVLGALFCALNARLSIWRMTHVSPHKSRRVAEVLAVVAATAAASFWMPFAFADGCSPAVPNYQCEHAQNRYYCDDAGSPDPLRLTCGLHPSNCTNAARYVSLPCEGGGGPTGGGGGGGVSTADFNTYATLSLQGEGQEGAILAFFHSPGRFDKAALAAYACLAFVLAVVTYGAQVPSGLFVPCILMGGAFGRLWGELLRDWAGAAILPGSYALVGAAAMLAGVTRITITLSVILYETTNQVTLVIPTMLAILVSKVIADRWNLSLYDIHIALKALPFIEPEPPLAMFGLTAKETMASPCVSLPSVVPCLEALGTLQSCAHSAFPLTDAEGRYCGMISREWLVLLLERQARTASPSDGAERRKAAAAAARARQPGRCAHSCGAASASTARPSPSDEEQSCGPPPPLLPAELRALHARQPRDAASGALLLSAEAAAALPPHALLDLRPYMDVGAATVSEACPATQCFELFRRLGLRHLPVLGLGHEAVGVITRQELTTDFHVGSVLRASL